MKRTLKILFAAICLITAIGTGPCFAQMSIPIGPGDGDGHNTPIGGMVVLAALGGGYAIKKLRDSKQ